jgi:hypothetical protein
MRSRLALMAGAVAMAVAGTALADTSSIGAPTPVAPPGGNAAAAATTPAPSAPTTRSMAPLPTITGVSVFRGGSVKDPPHDFQMGDTINVKLSSPEGWANLRARAAETKKKLGLFLNGHFLSDVAPVVVGKDEVAFKPTRNDASKGFWDELWGGHLLEQQALSVAIGLEDATDLVHAEGNLVMHPLQGARAFLLVVAGLLLLGLTILLAITTDIVRDGRRPDAGKLPTYSLGRTQMAFWFVNVVLAVLLIWAVTGAVPPITSSILSLIGIGAGTALGAVLVDQSSTSTAPPKDSKNFLMDILTDGGSIALHRFQMFVWTLVLFFVFWGAVWNRLALPEFDSTLLGLLGISAGTYLGFKFPENQASAKT